MTICQEAAGQSSWDRHVGQALSVVAEPPAPVHVPLRALEGGQDPLTAPGPGHPAFEALEKAERDRG